MITSYAAMTGNPDSKPGGDLAVEIGRLADLPLCQPTLGSPGFSHRKIE